MAIIQTLKKKLARIIDIIFGGKLLTWIPFFFQRIFLSKASRNFLFKINLLINHIAQRQMASVSLIENSSVSELKKSGLVFMPKILKNSQIHETVSYLQKKMVIDPYKNTNLYFPLPHNNEPQEFHVAYHKDEDVISAPHLMSLANNPDILKIAEGFLGVKPTISYIAAWWSFATNNEALQAENFHRDVDGITFLKYFCFLTDVDEHNGPHVYVPYSSNSSKFRDSIKRFSDEEVINEFGEESIKYITGPAGSNFLEDTFGLHKGLKLKSGRRLLFQVIYSTGKLPYSPKSPIMNFNEIGNDFSYDHWINRLYCKK